MNLNISRSLAGFSGGVITLIVFSQFGFTSGADLPTMNRNSAVEWKSPPLPDKLMFAGEAVPLQRWDVRERLDRELLFNFYNTPNVLYALKMAHRYFPVISERLKANGVPDDFKYLCMAESNLVAAAVSKSGAASFWQFLDKTAPGYNLTVNSEVDERYNILKATDAASTYLKRAHALLGSWTAAAASYNCGQAGYQRQAVFQQSKNYYDLHLPEETNRYIFRILTFKYLLENAASLGFKVDDSEKYAPILSRNVEVKTTVADLAGFAIAQGTTYRILKLMNPWIKGKTLTVSGNQRYTLQVPK